jgi:putative transposase
MKLYKNKYRIASARLKGHSYREGIFFVTICTRKKLQWFGEIRNGKMELSEVGEVVQMCVNKIPETNPSASVDSFCIMPDHVHIILALQPVETPQWGVSTSKQHWVPGNLSVIINHWKRACTKEIRTLHPDFSWQSRFHDHIIRSEKEREAIRRYIRSNPAKWDKETIPWHDDGHYFGL